jgi:hypothetical protein
MISAQAMKLDYKNILLQNTIVLGLYHVHLLVFTSNTSIIKNIDLVIFIWPSIRNDKITLIIYYIL